MSTTTDRPPRAAPAGPSAAPRSSGSASPSAAWRSELRAIRIVWRRELIRFGADRLRMVTSLVQPLLFLFVLGSGLQRPVQRRHPRRQPEDVHLPGILCIAVMFTAMFSAASIVWDREFGFLREMMVAPVRRSSIVIGKCLGGATVAGFQGVIVICLAGLVHVPYDPLLILGIFGLQLLLAFTITAFGVMIAVRIKQMQSFMGVMQMIVMPMFFISGALFPVSGLPGWLTVLNRLDPLTYAVDPMRRLVFSHLTHLGRSPACAGPGVTWWGWHVPALLEAAVIAGPRPGHAGDRDLGVQRHRVASAADRGASAPFELETAGA